MVFPIKGITMSIVRISHDKEKPYVMVNRQSLQDRQMSWNARGLWSYLISLPDNWEVSVAQLTKFYLGQKRGNKRDALYEMLKELIDLGYVQALQVKGEKGRFSEVDYIVYESKQAVPAKTTENKPNPSTLKKKVPKTAYPDTARPDPVKPTQTINNDREEIRHRNDINVKDDRSSFQSADIVSFCPDTYTLPNGKSLSPRMRNSLAKYSIEDSHKFLSNLAYFHMQAQKKFQKNEKFENQEAYLQTCIKNNYASKETNATQNSLYASFMKEEKQLIGLEVLKTVAKFDKRNGEPAISVSLNISPKDFSIFIDKYADYMKRNN